MSEPTDKNNIQFKQHKLQLLAGSKELLILAQNERWPELEVAQSQWQKQLEKNIATYGDQLAPIQEVLDQDQQQLIRLIARSQKQLTHEFSQITSKNKSLSKYLK